MFIHVIDKKIELSDVQSSSDIIQLENWQSIIIESEFCAEKKLGALYSNSDFEKLAACKSFIKRCKFFKNAISKRIAAIGSFDKRFRIAAREILDSETYKQIEEKADFI